MNPVGRAGNQVSSRPEIEFLAETSVVYDPCEVPSAPNRLSVTLESNSEVLVRSISVEVVSSYSTSVKTNSSSGFAAGVTANCVPLSNQETPATVEGFAHACTQAGPADTC